MNEINCKSELQHQFKSIEELFQMIRDTNNETLYNAVESLKGKNHRELMLILINMYYYLAYNGMRTPKAYLGMKLIKY